MSLQINEVQIDKYFFISQEIEANTEHDPSEELDILTDVTESFHDIKTRESFAVELSISSNSDKSTNLPYHFKIRAFGFFTITADEFEDDKAAITCAILGREILMGAIRERLVSLSSRGPWNPICLSIYEVLPE